MTRKTIAVLLGMILSLSAFTPTIAQTPDGQTPANEGICDDLRADGVTKGLYGLCVAFCEAQDHADILHPITEEEYDALLSTTPSGKILENYLKKANETDPPMPCIKIEEPCPCWSSQDLAEIDGVMWDGAPSNSTASTEPDGRFCLDATYSFATILNTYEIDRTRFIFTQAAVVDRTGGRSDNCIFNRAGNGPGGTSTVSNVFLNEEEVAACKASLRDFQANSNFCITILN